MPYGDDWGEFQETISGLGIEDPFSSQAIATGMGFPMQSQLFGALTPAMLSASNLQTYQPIAELQQQSMLGELTRGLGGVGMKKAMGGFAGSGGAMAQETSARDVYGKSAADVIKQISGLQQQGRRGVMDVISSWRNIAQGLQGTGTGGSSAMGGQDTGGMQPNMQQGGMQSNGRFPNGMRPDSMLQQLSQNSQMRPSQFNRKPIPLTNMSNRPTGNQVVPNPYVQKQPLY